MSRRLNRHKEPPYDFKEVPDSEPDLDGSVVVRIQSRPQWFSSIGELVQICNEAVRRRCLRSSGGKSSDAGKPLSLFYIADRLDTDDPIRGYMVRTKQEGWLQGFVITTTFTTWQRWFKWDSLTPCAGIVDKNGDVRASNANRRVDEDGEIAKQLNDQFHHGDVTQEGIIWPRLAEISLLGALGCGGWLVQLVIEEMEQADEYDWVVLQALDNSIGFYEKMGFTRVGAIAKYYKETIPTPAKGGREGRRGRARRAMPSDAMPETPRGGRTVGYRHWTWDDENINKLPKPSYMMARRLKRNPTPLTPATGTLNGSVKRGRGKSDKRRGGSAGRARRKAAPRPICKLERVKELLVKRPPPIKVTKKRTLQSPGMLHDQATNRGNEVDIELKQEHLWSWQGAANVPSQANHEESSSLSSSSSDPDQETPARRRRPGGQKRLLNAEAAEPTSSSSSDEQPKHQLKKKTAGAGAGRRGEYRKRDKREKVMVNWNMNVKLVWKSNPKFKPIMLKTSHRTPVWREKKGIRKNNTRISRLSQVGSGGRGHTSGKKKSTSTKKRRGGDSSTAEGRKGKKTTNVQDQENGSAPVSPFCWAKRGRGGRRISFGRGKGSGRGGRDVYDYENVSDNDDINGRSNHRSGYTRSGASSGKNHNMSNQNNNLKGKLGGGRTKRSQQANRFTFETKFGENNADGEEVEGESDGAALRPDEDENSKKRWNARRGIVAGRVSTPRGGSERGVDLSKRIRGVDPKYMHLYGKQIMCIRDMGFRNNKKIVDALRKCDGNIHVALEMLFR